MYHYVRPYSVEYPEFNHLEPDLFQKQLAYFENNFGFIDTQSFLNSLISGKEIEGIILTFDDGFSDHYHYVLPELVKRVKTTDFDLESLR